MSLERPRRRASSPARSRTLARSMTRSGTGLPRDFLDQAPEDVAAVERQEREEVDQAEREADHGEQQQRLARADVDRLVGDVADADDAGDLLALLRLRRCGRRPRPFCWSTSHIVSTGFAGGSPGADRPRSFGAVGEADQRPLRFGVVFGADGDRLRPRRRARSSASPASPPRSRRSACPAHRASATWSPNCRGALRRRVGEATGRRRRRSCRRAAAPCAAGVPRTISPTVWFGLLARRRRDAEEDHEGEHDVHRRARRRSRRSASRPAGVVGAVLVLRGSSSSGFMPVIFTKPPERDRADPVLGLAPLERPELRRRRRGRSARPASRSPWRRRSARPRGG